MEGKSSTNQALRERGQRHLTLLYDNEYKFKVNKENFRYFKSILRVFKVNFLR